MELGCVCSSSYGEHYRFGEGGDMVDSGFEVATTHLRQKGEKHARVRTVCGVCVCVCVCDVCDVCVCVMCVCV